MEKRIIIAFLLSFGVLYAFRALYIPPVNTPKSADTVDQASTPPGAPANAAPLAPVVTASTEGKAETLIGDIQATKAEDVAFDTGLYTATISNVGGVLKSYKLKAYADAEGHAIELINETGASKLGWPLSIVTSDAALNQALAKANFVVHQETDGMWLEFAGNGLYAKKDYRFNKANYDFSLETKLTKDGKSIPHSVVWQGGFGDQSLNEKGTPDTARHNAVYQSDMAFKRLALRSIKDQQAFTVNRVGVEDQYFLAMLLFPDSPVPVKLGKQDFPGADGKPVETLFVSATLPEANPIRIYMGPKDRQWLGKDDPLLASVVNYGWFEVIARPLLLALLFIHSYIGNFGWAIVLLTMALNFLLFPLRLKQQVSMQKMQKIQPQMRTLQDKYKKLKATDPRRAELQTEMMGLYKEHGVNPMGGCLPLLLQMPVLIGFYSMLSVSIELRRAPWLWIADLSRPNFIILIIMAISMIVLQKMTPTTVDPAQAKMMMIMPLMFTVMFYSQSSGLVLYWLTSNVLGIGQQVFINKYWSPHAEAKLQARAKTKQIRDK
jgi:YidC/Oxa1 family membrane protein insertase